MAKFEDEINRKRHIPLPGEWIIGVLKEVARDDRRNSIESDEYKTYVKKCHSTHTVA